MKLESLKPASGATKNRKKIARGQGSGKGGTAGPEARGVSRAARVRLARSIGFEAWPDATSKTSA